MVPPYKQARLIPRNVWKTKTDAWNGYHSCPLDVRDRHLTTFIAEKGRYRYVAAPQGFLASGDGYNQRYGRLIEDMERTTRCVDDLAMWDEDLEGHWWHVIRYIDRIAKNGIIISPKKFEFCSREIEFAGFRITETGVKPLHLANTEHLELSTYPGLSTYPALSTYPELSMYAALGTYPAISTYPEHSMYPELRI